MRESIPEAETTAPPIPIQPRLGAQQRRPWGPWLDRSDSCRGVIVCSVNGEVDSAGVSLLAPVLQSLVDEEGLAALVLDFSRVGFLGCRAVEVLLQAAGQAAAAQCEFLVVLGTRAVVRAFEVTGAETAIHCYQHYSEALAAASAWARYRTAVYEGVSNDAHRSLE